MRNSSAKLSGSFPAGVFGFFLAAFVLVTSARLFSVDDKIMFDVTKSMLASGSFASSEPLSERESFIEPWFYVQGKDGKSYSKYGLGQSLAIVPLFVAGKSVLPLIPQSYVDWFPPDYIPFKPPEMISYTERFENTIIPAFTSLLSPAATAISCLGFAALTRYEAIASHAIFIPYIWYVFLTYATT